MAEIGEEWDMRRMGLESLRLSRRPSRPRKIADEPMSLMTIGASFGRIGFDFGRRSAPVRGMPSLRVVGYVITEVVHCKSRGEESVDKAEKSCADQYLKRILETAAAHVIVALGDVAKRQIRRVFGAPGEG